MGKRAVASTLPCVMIRDHYIEPAKLPKRQTPPASI